MGQEPAIILVEPQLGENIGAAARAMRNFGLSDLRLVTPRDGWPNPDAVPIASAGAAILETAQVFGALGEAVSDLQRVYALTARSRDVIKPALTLQDAVSDIRGASSEGRKCGFLFGPERSGLSNDHLALADTIVSIPANPDFSSINLAQAVLLTGYQWFVAEPPRSPEEVYNEQTRPATKGELLGLMEHLESELDKRGFLRPPEKKPAMVRNLRNLWQRADLREQDVKTLRGIIVSLVSRP